MSALKVGVTFIVVTPDVMPELAARVTQEVAGLPNATMVSVSGTDLQLAGKKGLLWAGSMTPANDILVSLSGLNKRSIIKAARVIAATVDEGAAALRLHHQERLSRRAAAPREVTNQTVESAPLRSRA